MRNPPALLSAKLELLDRAGRQLREESVEALEGVQGSQYADEGDDLRATAGLDTLEGALADARPLGELSLGQARFDAVSRDPLADQLSNGCISQLKRDLHNSPNTATKDEIQAHIAIYDESYA